MNVFLSWSGERSRLVAEALKPWLKCVLQTTTPWISTADIDRGSLWMNEIGNKLQDSTIGIICLTAENQKNPWILFEAGALAKGLASNRVCTLLIDLQPSDIYGPLAQFNHTPFDRESVLKLIFGINSKLATPVDAETLNRTFGMFWAEIDEAIKKIITTTVDAPPIEPPKDSDVLKDVVTGIGSILNRLSNLESKMQNPNSDISSVLERINSLDKSERNSIRSQLIAQMESELQPSKERYIAVPRYTRKSTISGSS
jgi:hypothetical protein